MRVHNRSQIVFGLSDCFWKLIINRKARFFRLIIEFDMPNSINNRKMRCFSIINRKMRHFRLLIEKLSIINRKRRLFRLLIETCKQPVFIFDLAAAITEKSLKTKNSLGMDDSLKQKY